MATVRARRSGRGGEPPRGRRRAPPPQAIPRLAHIKLNGGLSGDDVKVSGKSLAVALAGAVLVLGVSVAGATWLGASLFDAREAFASAADSAAAEAGFGLDRIAVAALQDSPPISPARAEEVRSLVLPEGRRSLLAADPDAVQARVQSLDWVAEARVRRLWPSTLRVEIKRRQEYALWEEAGEVSVIDVNGERLLAERAADHPSLPRLRGAGAGQAAEPLLVALESLPAVRARIAEAERISGRRWNLRLRSGALVALPEADAARALAALERLQRQYALLDRPLARLDLRTPGRLAVRIHPELDGGPHPATGGA